MILTERCGYAIHLKANAMTSQLLYVTSSTQLYMFVFGVCVFFGFLQGFLFAVIVSSQLFKRKRHRSEASVLTLVLNHVQSVKT